MEARDRSESEGIPGAQPDQVLHHWKKQGRRLPQLGHDHGHYGMLWCQWG